MSTIKAVPNKFIAVDLIYDKDLKETIVQFALPVIAWNIEGDNARPVTPTGVKRSGYAIIERVGGKPEFVKTGSGFPKLKASSMMRVIVNYCEDTITNAEILEALDKLGGALKATNACVRVSLDGGVINEK